MVLLLALLPAVAAADPPLLPPPAWQLPQLHYRPACLNGSGWHDIAGALTFDEKHHVFQGCPNGGGWSHATSRDLVHWEDLGISGPRTINETFAGMQSNVSPCSGFVSTDGTDVVCAGFRQCSSRHGVTGLNPEAQKWDVPLELRCAKHANLTEWGDPEYVLPVYYYRALPYDPVRPWKDDDGKWYTALAMDGCNATTRKTPCAAGGRLELWQAPSFKGPWTQAGPLFTTNTTKSGAAARPGAITGEFVTPDYIGGLPGDPAGGATRVVTQSGYWTGQSFWVGRQPQPGGPFSAYWDRYGAVGHHDYGDLFMARTLGSESNQVAANGRRVLIGWISDCNGGGCVDYFASQSVPRDLSLSPDFELLQAFAPELKLLREGGGARAASSMQLEVFASFSFNASAPPAGPFGVEVLGSQDGRNSTKLLVDCTRVHDGSNCTVGIDGSNCTSGRRRGGPVALGPLLPVILPHGHTPPAPLGAGWTAVASKGSFGDYDAGAAAFAAALAASPSKLVRRDCASCDDAAARHVFYKRLTPLPAYDLLNVLKNSWTLERGNQFNIDFELYSTLDDALAGDSSKRWAFCNGDDPDVGAFRDCGPEIRGPGQWNSFNGHGGQPDVRFAVATGAKPSPPPPPPPPPGMVTVSVHAVVDHGIVEAIFNNRTAISMSALSPAATWTAARLFGPVPENHTVQMWNLKGIHEN